jgi:hypothetical protein
MLTLSDQQLEAVASAAALLQPMERDKFMNPAASLNSDPSDADVDRALARLLGTTPTEQ